MFKFGFIGTGNMGGALAAAACVNTDPADILLADSCAEKSGALAERLGCSCGDVLEAAAKCRYIILGVKPQSMQGLFDELAPVLRARKDRFVLVSMAAGIKIERIEEMAGSDYPVIRIMPNMAAAVGEGMILCTANGRVTGEELDGFVSGMKGAGRIDMTDERLFDAGCALSGSGPAFVYLFIEALSDGAVACGLPRKQALEYAAQTVLGSAKLMLETGRHPGDLKDAVCSPAGTTIAGVRALESAGFRSAATEAVAAAYAKSVELSK